jgi:hypothetical protein
MVRKAEDDLYALAAKAGTEAEASTKAGVSVGTIFLEPESGQRPINEKGDDPGFETRVKPPRGRPRKTADTKPDEPKPRGRPSRTAVERSSQEIADALQQKADEFFAVISIGLPVTGTYGVENSEKSIKALMAIAKRRPGLMKALMRVADGADGLDLGRTVLGLGVALQVDLGRIPADMLIARATGVTAIVEKYFADNDGPQNENVTTQVTHASPRFTPVS